MMLAGREVALQRGAEVLCGPAPHGAVDRERRPIHSISAAQHPGAEAADEKA